MTDRLKGKTAIVSGAANEHGIGFAVARRFVEEGAEVILADIEEEAGNARAAELGAQSQFIRCDHSKREHCRNVLQAADQRWGRLDILHNNAGRGWFGALEEPTDEVQQSYLDSNLLGPWRMTQEALPLLRKALEKSPDSTPTVLFTITNMINSFTAGASIYGITKMGVYGMMRSFAEDLGPQGIRVNAIAPGGTETQAFRDMWNTNKGADEALARMRAGTPLRRNMRQIDMANAALFLASDEAANINAVMLTVDGGRFPR